MKIKHIVSCLFVSLIGFSACSIEELPYNQLTEDELDGSYESLLSATRGNYAVFKNRFPPGMALCRRTGQ